MVRMKLTRCIVVLCCASYCFSFPADELTTAATTFTTPPVVATTPSLFQQLRDSISSLFDSGFGLESLLSGIVKPAKTLGGLTLRTELVAISLDQHLRLPAANGSENQNKQRLFSQSVVQMWQTLRFMDRVDRALVNATESIFGLALAESDKATKRMLDEIRKGLQEDEELRNEIRKTIGTVEFDETSFLPMEEGYNAAVLRKFLQQKPVRRLVLNKRFILGSRPFKSIEADNKSMENYVVGKTILKLANQTEHKDLIQRMYDDSLSDVADRTDPVENLAAATIALFDDLRTKMEMLDNMRDIFEKTKKNVQAEKIEEYERAGDPFDQYLFLWKTYLFLNNLDRIRLHSRFSIIFHSDILPINSD